MNQTEMKIRLMTEHKVHITLTAPAFDFELNYRQ